MLSSLLLSSLMSGLLRGLLCGRLLCLGLLLRSQERSILMWAIHRLLGDCPCPCRRVHGCLLLALDNDPAQMLGSKLSYCLGR